MNRVREPVGRAHVYMCVVMYDDECLVGGIPFNINSTDSQQTNISNQEIENRRQISNE